MNQRLLNVFYALALLLATSTARALEVLSDAELEGISARGFELQLGATASGGAGFSFTRPDGLASGSGSLDLGALGGGVVNLSSVNLSGNAQQNVRSLINTIAVNSQVQVMVNLTVNVNSRTGPIHQGNHGFISF